MTIDLSNPQIKKISYQCLLKIQSVYDSLKSAERKAADYLMADPESFARGTIVEVAAKADCSESTLVRLGYRLGFDGYSGLKNSILRESTKGDFECLYEGIDKDDDAPTVMEKVMRASVQSIEDTLRLIDSQTYQKAVDAILAAGKLEFAGIGDAGIVAMFGYYKFFRLGMNASFSQDYDVALMMATQLGVGDVLVAVSHSGTTKTTLDTVHCAREKGATILAITNSPGSSLGRQADILITTAAFGENIIGERMAKRMPAFCVIESLYINALMRTDRDKRVQLEQRDSALWFNK